MWTQFTVPMISLQGLTKRYGDTVAVDDLSFDITPGCVTGFLGPNGAGKTTTMRMILGLDAPTKGTAHVNGKPYAQHKFPLHEVGALLDAKALHGGRRASDHLLCLAQSNGIGRKRVTEVLELVGLTDVARKRAGTFSLGMGQRLGIAGALLGDPGVLMFDEPVNGLDPEGIVWIRTLLRWLASEGRTVFVSSHLMTEMSMTADRLIVVGRGKLIADATVDEFTARGEQWVQVRSARPDDLDGVLVGAGATSKVVDGERQVRGLTPTQIGDLALGAGIAIYGLTEQRATLEEVFFGLTGDSVEYHGAVGPPNAAAFRRRRCGMSETRSPSAVNMAAVNMAVVSTAAVRPDAEHAHTTHPVPDGSTLVAAIRSEITKLRSVRSTVWALVLTAAFTIGLGSLFCWAYVHRQDRGFRIRNGQAVLRDLLFDPASRSLRGVVLAQLAIGVLGVLVMSSEYTTGMIRTSLAAVPKRRTLLLAKGIVLGAVSVVVAMVSVFIAFGLGQAILSQDHLGASIGDTSVLRAILGAGLYLILIGLFGLAIGTIVRRTPGAIATLFGIVLILPLIAQAFPEPWDVRIGRLAPLNAGEALYSVRYDPDLLTPTQGLLVFLGWVVAAYIVAAIVLARRDA